MTQESNAVERGRPLGGMRARGESPHEPRAEKYATPRVDIAELKDSFILVADLPGVSDSGLSIEIEKGVLTLTARTVPFPSGELTLQRREHGLSGYRRSFAISEAINVEGVEAHIKNGVLRITLPKSERVKSRKITVNAH